MENHSVHHFSRLKAVARKPDIVSEFRDMNHAFDFAEFDRDSKPRQLLDPTRDKIAEPQPTRLLTFRARIGPTASQREHRERAIASATAALIHTRDYIRRSCARRRRLRVFPIRRHG